MACVNPVLDLSVGFFSIEICFRYKKMYFDPSVQYKTYVYVLFSFRFILLLKEPI